MKTNMNMNINMKMKMKMKMKMNMNSCTKTMYDSFWGRRQRPQAWELDLDEPAQRKLIQGGTTVARCKTATCARD